MSDKNLTVDELIDLVLIDTKHNKKLSIGLTDKDGGSIRVQEVVAAVSSYVSDKMKSEDENAFVSEIFPLMSQATVIGLSETFGAEGAATILASEEIRYALINMMLVGFTLLKFIQKHEIKIYSTKTDISEEEVQRYKRLSKASDALTRASLLGIAPKELLKAMLSRGMLETDDLQQMGVSPEAAEELLKGVIKEPVN